MKKPRCRYAPHVKVPTVMAQLRRDFLIHAERDGQAIFDALGAQEKFAALDGDGDGRISVEEMAAGLGAAFVLS